MQVTQDIKTTKIKQPLCTTIRNAVEIGYCPTST